MSRCRVVLLILASLSWAPAAFAQESVSFKMTEHVFNAGGHPAAGVTMQSARYLMTLDSIGEGLSEAGLLGTRYIMGAGFGEAYPPPGEVAGVRFEASDVLAWDVHPSAGRYDVYRDTVGSLAGSGGACVAWDLSATPITTSSPDCGRAGYPFP